MKLTTILFLLAISCSSVMAQPKTESTPKSTPKQVHLAAPGDGGDYGDGGIARVYSVKSSPSVVATITIGNCLLINMHSSLGQVKVVLEDKYGNQCYVKTLHTSFQDILIIDSIFMSKKMLYMIKVLDRNNKVIVQGQFDLKD